MQSAVRWETGLALVVVAIFAFGVAVSPDFLTASNLFNLGVTSGEVAIMALPMTLIIIGGEIDLSVASILGMSSALLGFLWARHWPMLAIFVMVALLAVIFGVVLHFTATGRSIYAMGASPEAALYAGIRVKRIKLLLFVTSGLVCALAGVLWTFRLSTAVQNNGIGMELTVVAIVLLAGVSIFGGKGSIIGVVLAVLAFAGLQLISVFVPTAGSVVARSRDWFRARGHRAPSAIGAGHE